MKWLPSRSADLGRRAEPILGDEVRFVRKVLGAVGICLILAASLSCSRSGPPTGWRSVVVRGVTVYFPGDWPVVHQAGPGVICAASTIPDRPKVIVGETELPASVACALGRTTGPGGNGAVLLVAPMSGESPIPPHARRVTVQRHFGYELDVRPIVAGHPGQGYEAALLLPQAGTLIVMRSYDPGLVRTVLGSIVVSQHP